MVELRVTHGCVILVRPAPLGGWSQNSKYIPITATSDIDKADSSDDMVDIGNDDLDDIGPTLVNKAVRMKRFEKVFEDVSW